MKTKKTVRFLSMAIVTVMIAVFAAVGAGACTPEQRAKVIAQAADTQITLTVKTAQAVGDTLLAAGFSSDSPVVLRLIETVRKQTDRIGDRTAERLDRLGVPYQCETYTVVIAGNSVLIDPLKIC